MIGILDSGVGGLSIYKEIKNSFPEVATVYFADKTNFPYGSKTGSELNEIVSSAIKTLVDLGANIVVLACNSATVTTVNKMRERFSIPIVGVEPAVKTAASMTRNGKIGVLATARTTKKHDSTSLAPNCNIYKHDDASLVAKIEFDSTKITDNDLVISLQPLLNKEVDCVVLGCTHFHFIKKRLEEMFPNITFISPEKAVVERLKSVIRENNVELTIGNDIFLCSADSEVFRKSLNNLLGIINADIRKI